MAHQKLLLLENCVRNFHKRNQGTHGRNITTTARTAAGRKALDSQQSNSISGLLKASIYHTYYIYVHYYSFCVHCYFLATLEFNYLLLLRVNVANATAVEIEVVAKAAGNISFSSVWSNNCRTIEILQEGSTSTS